MLSVTSLNATMPDTDVLWQARSASEWLGSYEQVYGTFQEQPLSLHDLFRRFMDGELADHHIKLSPTQLRLLLHPLQALVCHLRQYLSCFSDGGSHCKASRAITKSATRARLEEVRCLLQQWYAFFDQSTQNSTNLCSTASANLIIYHLISLNTITCFPEIGRIARREEVQGPFRQSSWLQMRRIEEVEEIFFRCGQILRLVRSMPERVRPPWWAAAVYRVALMSWANSMANAGARFPMSGSKERGIDAPFAIDALAPEHPSIVRYLKYREGLPMVSKPDGTMVSMELPGHVLTHCIEVLDEDSTMRLTAGIKNKLGRLAERWKT